LKKDQSQSSNYRFCLPISGHGPQPGIHTWKCNETFSGN